jgi:hypothetical protein
MRAPLTVAALVAVLAACAMPQGSAHPPGGAYQPLRAYITGPEFGGLGFQVNRPAHVALFEVVPGRGTALVYPATGMGSGSTQTTMGRFNLGMNRIAGRELYHPAHASVGLVGPRFYFLIASVRPLNLDSFGTFGMGTMRALGTELAAYNAFSTMERLAQVALPSTAPDGSWTSDVYMHWPQAVSSAPAPRHVLLTCNGYQVHVRLEYLALVQQTLCAPQSNAPTAAPSDTAGAPSGEVIPRRRAPPEPDRGSVSEQVRTSAQLEEGRSMRERRTLERREIGAAERQERVERGVEARPRPGAGRGATQPGSMQRGETRVPREAPSAQPERSPPPARETQQRPPPEPRAEPAPTPAPERCRDC